MFKYMDACFDSRGTYIIVVCVIVTRPFKREDVSLSIINVWLQEDCQV